MGLVNAGGSQIGLTCNLVARLRVVGGMAQLLIFTPYRVSVI